MNIPHISPEHERDFAYPSPAKDKGRWRRESVLDVYNCVLALFLFVSPWLFAFASEAARIDIWASSAAIALAALATFVTFSDWEEWLNLLLGIWLVLSPWVLGFAHTRAMHFSIGIGAAVAFMSAIELWLLYDATTQEPGSSRRH
jgi:hypothetical protein